MRPLPFLIVACLCLPLAGCTTSSTQPPPANPPAAGAAESLEVTEPEIRVVLHRDRMAAYGLTAVDVAEAIRALPNLTSMGSATIPVSDGRLIPLSEVTSIEMVPATE